MKQAGLARHDVPVLAAGSKEVFGLDANFGVRRCVNVGGYVAKYRTEGLDDKSLRYRGQFNYDHDRSSL